MTTKAMKYRNLIAEDFGKDPDSPWHQGQVVIKLETKLIICQNLATLM